MESRPTHRAIIDVGRDHNVGSLAVVRPNTGRLLLRHQVSGRAYLSSMRAGRIRTKGQRIENLRGSEDCIDLCLLARAVRTPAVCDKAAGNGLARADEVEP